MGTFIVSDFISTDTTAPVVRQDYAADTFTRPGPALGSTEIGGYAWTQNSGSVHQIVGNRLQLSTIPATSHALAWFEESHTDGILSATAAALTGNPNRGLIVGYSAGTGTGYLLVNDGTNYTIRARAANGSMTTLATSAGITPVVGDKLEFQTVGAALTVRVNGVQILTATNSTHTHGTGKGVWAFANGGSTTNRVEWDDLAWSAI